MSTTTKYFSPKLSLTIPPTHVPPPEEFTMVDVAVEILSCSVPVPRENLIFTVKTWWTQVEVEGSKNFVKLPALPMIEQFFRMKQKETVVFVEVWYANEELFPPGTRRFLGMSKSVVDPMLSHPQASPAIEWLDVYDPIENFVRGKMLLKVHASFSSTSSDVERASSPASAVQPYAGPSTSSVGVGANHLPSSYFGTKERLPNSSVESSPFSKRSIPVQTEEQEDTSPDKPTPDDPTRSAPKILPKDYRSNGNANQVSSKTLSVLKTTETNRQISYDAVRSRFKPGGASEIKVTGKSCMSSREAKDDPIVGANSRGNGKSVKLIPEATSTNIKDSKRSGGIKSSQDATNNNEIDSIVFQEVDAVLEKLKNLDSLKTPVSKKTNGNIGISREKFKDVPHSKQNPTVLDAKLQNDWKDYLAKRNGETPSSTKTSYNSNSPVSTINAGFHEHWNDRGRDVFSKHTDKNQTLLDGTSAFSAHIKPTPMSSQLLNSGKSARSTAFPPRSTRIAAAIYNDYPDGLGN